jgi:hypothetical protein
MRNIENLTNTDLKIEVFTSTLNPLNPSQSECTIIPAGKLVMIKATRLRFILSGVHYTIDSPNRDEMKLTDPIDQGLYPNMKITTYPCCADQINPVLIEIKELQELISKSENNDEIMAYAQRLLECKEKLQSMVGNLDKFWSKFGIGIPLLAGAATPAAVVATIQGIGFTASGITAGSTAATMMSFGGGSTASGGIVATLQSIGATGALSASAAALAALSGAAISGILVFGCIEAFRRINHSNNNHDSCWAL